MTRRCHCLSVDDSDTDYDPGKDSDVDMNNKGEGEEGENNKKVVLLPSPLHTSVDDVFSKLMFSSYLGNSKYGYNVEIYIYTYIELSYFFIITLCSTCK